MTKNEHKNKRCANADWSDAKKPSKRRRNKSVTTPDAAQSNSNVADAQEVTNQLRISFSSRVTPIRYITPQITPASSTAISQSSLQEITSMLPEYLVSSMESPFDLNMNTPVSADFRTDKLLLSDAGSHPSVLSHSMIQNLNHSRVSLVSTENASENDFELDAKEISFRDWESSLGKGTTTTASIQHSWFNNFVGLGLILSLIVTLLWRFQGGPHVTMYIQSAFDPLVAQEMPTPENKIGMVQLLQTEQQLEAAVHELQSTSSKLQSSQRHFETVSQELEQVRLKMSDLEQQLQETTDNMESTKETSQIATQLLDKAKALLRIQEKQLMASQHEVTRQDQELQQLYHHRQSTLAETQAAVHAMSQTHKEMEEIRALLRFKEEQVQQAENSQTRLQHSLIAANLDNFGTSLEIVGFRNEISDLQSLHVSQAHDLIVARLLCVELARKAAEANTAEQVNFEALIRTRDELATKTGAMEQLAATVKGMTKKFIDSQNELVETNELLSLAEQKLLLFQMSHVRTKDELFYTMSELWENQIALNNMIEVLLDSEEEIDRLIKQNAMQEKLATYTVNFVATLAINQQQQVAAEAINFMTTFASTYYSHIRQGDALQEISPTHDEIVYFK